MHAQARRIICGKFAQIIDSCVPVLSHLRGEPYFADGGTVRISSSVLEFLNYLSNHDGQVNSINALKSTIMPFIRARIHRTSVGVIESRPKHTSVYVTYLRSRVQ